MKSNRGGPVVLCTPDGEEISVEVSLCGKKDIDGMHQIESENFDGSIAWSREYFKNMLEENTIFGAMKAVVDGKMAGFVVWNDDWNGNIEIEALQVRKPMQSKGVGSCLLDTLIRSFQKPYTVTTKVSTADAKTVRMFENRGFKPMKVSDRKKLGFVRKVQTCNDKNVDECTIADHFGDGKDALRMGKKISSLKK